MKELRINVSAIMPDDSTDRQRKVRAIRAWSIVNGVAMLVLDGRLPYDETNKTPNLDRMAKEGNVLRQFYVSITACTPSRSALMTGLLQEKRKKQDAE